MIVKFLLPHTDPEAKEMVSHFKRDGFASFGIKDRHCGFIRQAGEERGRILIVAEVTEPGFAAWIREMVGDGENYEIEVEEEHTAQYASSVSTLGAVDLLQLPHQF